MYSFVTVDPLRMATWCQNMKEFDTCHELYFMVCILLSAFFVDIVNVRMCTV